MGCESGFPNSGIPNPGKSIFLIWWLKSWRNEKTAQISYNKAVGTFTINTSTLAYASIGTYFLFLITWTEVFQNFFRCDCDCDTPPWLASCTKAPLSNQVLKLIFSSMTLPLLTWILWASAPLNLGTNLGIHFPKGWKGWSGVTTSWSWTRHVHESPPSGHLGIKFHVYDTNEFKRRWFHGFHRGPRWEVFTLELSRLTTLI